MKNAINRVLAMTIAFALSFTIIPAVSGGLDVHAASKPAKVTKLRLAATGQTTARVSWNKIKKGLNGYTVFRNGRAIRHLGKNVTSLSDAGLSPGTTYSYYVRAYKNTKQKQWFNKKTKKWQKKKPARKFRGKSRRVTVKVYGKASTTLRITTRSVPKTQNNSNSSSTARSIKVSASDIKQNSVILTWTSVQDATTYDIYRDNVKIASVTGLNYSDTELEKDTEYIYVIKAMKGTEALIQNNGLKIITSFDANAILKRTDSGMELSWDSDGNITRVEIYKGDIISEGSGYKLANEKLIKETTEKSFVDESVTSDEYPGYMIKMYRGDVLRKTLYKWSKELPKTNN